MPSLRTISSRHEKPHTRTNEVEGEEAMGGGRGHGGGGEAIRTFYTPTVKGRGTLLKSVQEDYVLKTQRKEMQKPFLFDVLYVPTEYQLADPFMNPCKNPLVFNFA